jgi:hypothetical protein
MSLNQEGNKAQCEKAVRSSKFKAPTSRESPSTKVQLVLERLVILWSLDVGTWCFWSLVLNGLKKTY